VPPLLLRNNHVISNAVEILIVGSMCANLAFQSIIINMASYLYDLGKLMMKSMHILCHGPGGINNGCKKRA